MTKKSIVQRLRDIFFSEIYQLHLLFDPKTKYQVMSIGETIQSVREEKKSLIRFGDGEWVLIRGKSIPTQEYDPELSKKLTDVVSTDEEGLLIAITDIFYNLEPYQAASRRFWKEHLFFCRKYYRKYLDSDRVYANAFFSRGYLTLNDHTDCAKWFQMIKEIWKGKDVFLVEGETSYNGVGNDLFKETKSVKRVICKSKNCFADYDFILDACINQECDLFLLSIGATAKPLALDLFHMGYWVIDIGNLNIEYTAYCHGFESKEKMKKCWNNKIKVQKNIENYKEYQLQIVKNIV